MFLDFSTKQFVHSLFRFRALNYAFILFINISFFIHEKSKKTLICQRASFLIQIYSPSCHLSHFITLARFFSFFQMRILNKKGIQSLRANWPFCRTKEGRKGERTQKSEQKPLEKCILNSLSSHLFPISQSILIEH